MSLLVMSNNLIDYTLCGYSELSQGMSIVRLDIADDKPISFPKDKVRLIVVPAYHQASVILNLRFALLGNNHIERRVDIQLYLSMYAGHLLVL